MGNKIHSNTSSSKQPARDRTTERCSTACEERRHYEGQRSFPNSKLSRNLSNSADKIIPVRPGLRFTLRQNDDSLKQTTEGEITPYQNRTFKNYGVCLPITGAAGKTDPGFCNDGSITEHVTSDSNTFNDQDCEIVRNHSISEEPIRRTKDYTTIKKRVTRSSWSKLNEQGDHIRAASSETATLNFSMLPVKKHISKRSSRSNSLSRFGLCLGRREPKSPDGNYSGFTSDQLGCEYNSYNEMEFSGSNLNSICPGTDELNTLSVLQSKPHCDVPLESVQTLNLLIQTLKTDAVGHRKQLENLKELCQVEMEHVKQVGCRLVASRSTGLKLEAANKCFISESMKRKYLQIELAQLSTELERRRITLETKQQEKLDLTLDLDRLQRLKIHQERLCKEALLESTLTSRRLQDIHERCNGMEVYRDEDCQLRNMICNLQAALGRIRVLVALKSTVHESCIRYISSSELMFIPPDHLISANDISKIQSEPVTCKLSHVIQPGSCNTMELYNHITTTIAGVVDGLNACLVTVGPRSAGKSSTFFGDLVNRLYQLNRPTFHPTRIKERRAFFHQLSTNHFTNLTQLSRSDDFAKFYGILGLCLVHFLQYIHSKTVVPTCVDGESVTRMHELCMAAFLVPLDPSQPEYDLLANRSSTAADLKNPDYGKIGSTVMYQPIPCFSEAIRICEKLHNRIDRENIPVKSGESIDLKWAHKVVIIRLSSQSRGAPSSSPTISESVLLLLDTVGLDSDSTSTVDSNVSSAGISWSIHAWNDVASLSRVMRINPDISWFGQTRILRILKPFILPEKPRDHMVPASCCFLLHLPCDTDQAYPTMQCLRLGLWLLQLNHGEDSPKASDRNQAELKKLTVREKSKVVCSWQLGLVGSCNTMRSYSPNNVRMFGCHAKPQELQRTSSVSNNLTLTSGNRLTGLLQRAQSLS